MSFIQIQSKFFQVLIDELLGTGDSAVEFLRSLREEWGSDTPLPSVKFAFVAIAGFRVGADKVEAEAQKMGLELEVILGDPLGAGGELFGENSDVFPESGERNVAKSVAEEIGRQLAKRWPFGYGDLQAAVVFDGSCPNNSLPILWAESPEWAGLFPRH